MSAENPRKFAHTFFILLLFCVLSKSLFAQIKSQNHKKIRDLTTSLIGLEKAYLRSEGNLKQEVKIKLINKAKERNEILKELIRSDPDSILEAAISKERAKSMPLEVKNYLEQKVNVSGKLEVLVEDYPDGTHKQKQFLKSENGKRYEVHMTSQSDNLLTDQEVSIQGVLLAQAEGDGQLVTNQQSVTTLQCCESTSSYPPAGRSTFGEQKTLVLLVNFEDKQQTPWTKEQVQDVIYNKVNQYYLESSNNRTWFTGEVHGWLTIAMSYTQCDQYGLEKLAIEAALNAGISTSSYSRIVFAFPKNGCGWGGLGMVGGMTTRAWLNGTISTYVTGHELGHNLGLGHSGGLECGADQIEGSCYRNGYANRLDLMGAPNVGHFNAFQKERLGWIDQEIISVDAAGDYTIDSYITGKTKVLKILRPTYDTTTRTESLYYIELRQSYGHDSFITNSTSERPITSSNVLNGVIITRGNINSYDSSRLIDMTPGSFSGDYDFNDPALEVGETFVDEAAGVSIKTNWVNNGQANVSISFSSTQCISNTPTLTIPPPAENWAAAGNSLNYQVKITNNDSASCSQNTFILNSSTPTGWTTSFTNSSMTLAPGASASTILSITSPETAIDGFYDIKINADYGNDSISGTATYVVDNPIIKINNVPLAQDDAAITDEGISVSIAVLANDSDADGDTLTIESATASNGSTVINSTINTITFTPAVGFIGDTTVEYTINDGKGGTAKAIIYITVQELPDTTNPIVTILTPTDNSIVSNGQQLDIAIEAKDNKGIARVELKINGVLIQTFTATPYNYTFEIPKGKEKNFLIEAFAFDTSNNPGSAGLTISKSDSTKAGGTNKGRKR